MNNTSSGTHLGDDTRFAEAFEAAWSSPTSEGLAALMQPDVELRQPGKPPIQGRKAAKADFARLLKWLPRLHGIVDRSVSAHGHCMIEYRLIIPIGRSPLELRAVDTFVLKDNLIAEREVYYDPGALRNVLIRHPWRLFGFLRYIKSPSHTS